ncbi:MAG: pilus assembly protein [Actinomycetota bacterium]|nr:pilus assembly protein [Actinomycetota bacterium]
MVEFALVLPILLMLVLGMIQYGWYFYVSETASGAASNVTRRLSVGDCWPGTQAYDYARKQSPKVTGVTKSPTDLSVAAAGDLLAVTVTADANMFGLFPLPDDGIVTRVVNARLEDTTAGPSC